MLFSNSGSKPTIQFDLPKEQASIIKVVGVGGGGSNAVNHMFNQGIRGVNFVICNTDEQAMQLSAIPNKIQLGPSLTSGLGAGSNPEVGKLSAEESLEEIRSILEKNTKMVFITAGMGGGTGTGGAPVISKIAKEMGILTVGIVTTPFSFEGRRKQNQAKEGIDELRRFVDSIIVISNDKIREIYGNLTRSDAFAKADNILAIAARSISEIITVPGEINVDFADVQYVMKDSGVAIMGAASAEGEDRAIRAVQAAINSPLLNDNNIMGAKKILLNITSGTGSSQVKLDEIDEISAHIVEACGKDTDIIFGTCDDENMGDKINVTVIATGFEENPFSKENKTENKVVFPLQEKKQKSQPENATPENESKSIEPFEIKVPASENPRVVELDVKANSPQSTTPEDSANPTNEPAQPPKTVVPPVTPVTSGESKTPEPFVFRPRTETPVNPPVAKADTNSNSDDRFRRATEVKRLTGPQSYTEMEKEPAYMRRRIELNTTPHSSESSMSRLTFGTDNPNDGILIRKNNSFLHDNVD